MDFTYKTMSFNQFQSMMLKWMFKGVLCTAITSLFMIVTGIIKMLSFAFIPMAIIFGIIEIIMVIILIHKIADIDMNKAKFYFYLYSIMNGITLSFILSAIHPMVGVLVFGITSAYFGLLYSITQFIKSDVSLLGRVCMAMLPVLVISYIILFFIQLPALYYATILIDLVVFSGLTIYDFKMTRQLYEESHDDNIECNALLCALQLYLDFINIFLDIVMLVADN